ncbi:MAG TPA: DegT/DnrJ/EryC1/StrS family aminotransferase [candidate division Zixibacteria bacterium]|nr:DegT/DnrJ/EryC1/StrS family aminotransferase [candidate division Zixibacteria bacterium]
MKINYLDLPAQYQSIKTEIDQAIQAVLDKSAYVLGQAVADFEGEFANFCDVSYCAGVNSGTSALLLALRALDIGPGDEVITAANTFVATAAAIVHAGAQPVLVDVDPVSRNIDPELVSMAISSRTRAIIPVHLYGCPADMNSILKLAGRYGLSVIEDAAQAQGARYRGLRTGSMGHIAAFSFYPGKNLGAYGEAGAITTDDQKLDETVRMLRDHGSKQKYVHELLGYNARMEGIQGAVLNVKLRYLEKWNRERNRVAALYNQLLSDLPITLPNMADDDIEQVFHVYVIETDRRDELQAFLAKEGVPSLIHYPIPIHLQKAFDYLNYRKGEFPVTERLADQVLSLPIYPEITDEQVTFVAGKVKSFFGAH